MAPGVGDQAAGLQSAQQVRLIHRPSQAIRYLVTDTLPTPASMVGRIALLLPGVDQLGVVFDLISLQLSLERLKLRLAVPNPLS